MEGRKKREWEEERKGMGDRKGGNRRKKEKGWEKEREGMGGRKKRDGR